MNKEEINKAYENLRDLEEKYPEYNTDLYNDDDYSFNNFLIKYLPLCKDELTKQALFNVWATYWKGEIVPYIKRAIDMGWKINVIPILFIACEWRDTDFITELLKNGADPNVSFNYENSLEWVINGHHASYTDCERKSAYESLYECLLILEKYGLKYNLYDEFDDNLSEFINKCPIPDLKKRLESIKFK